MLSHAILLLAVFAEAELADFSDLRDVEDLFDGAALGHAWSISRHHRNCQGSLTALKRDEATLAKSHAGYGQEPYPEDYFCRWLFLPDGCDLGVECDVGTKRNLRRSRSFNKCHDGDYVRVVGYKGASDNFYCGLGAGFNIRYRRQNENSLKSLVSRQLFR